MPGIVLNGYETSPALHEAAQCSWLSSLTPGWWRQPALSAWSYSRCRAAWAPRRRGIPHQTHSSCNRWKDQRRERSGHKIWPCGRTLEAPWLWWWGGQWSEGWQWGWGWHRWGRWCGALCTCGCSVAASRWRWSALPPSRPRWEGWSGWWRLPSLSEDGTNIVAVVRNIIQRFTLLILATNMQQILKLDIPWYILKATVKRNFCTLTIKTNVVSVFWVLSCDLDLCIDSLGYYLMTPLNSSNTTMQFCTPNCRIFPACFPLFVFMFLYLC